MKKAKFNFEGKNYQVWYDCPDKEINDQINEIFSDKDYGLAKRKKNMIVLDIGANVGMFSLFIKDWAQKIYAVEPSKRIFECLKKNTESWDNIEIFNVGLFNKKGKQFLYGKNEQTPQTMMTEGENKELIDTVLIDEFIKENNIDHIDVMKIDTEGAEYIIFADDSFKQIADRIDFIIGESHYINNMVPEHILEMLKQVGFEAKLLPFNNQYLWLNYENIYTGQKSRFEIKKPTIFVGARA